MSAGRRYKILDVFSVKALEGNPLAVVLDSEGLDEAAMQRIAGEFNLAETVFVMAPAEARHTARIRIFTPRHEMPFAGHPTVGAACLIAAERFGLEDEREAIISLEEKIGLVTCAVRIASGALFAEFDTPRLAERVGAGASPAAAAAALGLGPGDIGLPGHQVSHYSAGVPFHFVPVASLEALGRASPDTGAWVAAFGAHEHPNAYLYTTDTGDAAISYRTRMFWPSAGVFEDPATGSAAAAFAGVLAQFEKLGDGLSTFTIGQGFEMGRPSRIHLEVEMAGGRLRRARVGGDAVIIAEGKLFI